MKREVSDKIIAKLEEQYPVAVCSLNHGGDPWKLLVMSILSAQCTDARVNIASEGLFERFPTAHDMGAAEIEEIESYIRSCGLYHNKAAAIKTSSQAVDEKFGGKIPSSMEDLTSLPGVGSKIANLIRGDIFGYPAVVCDTHCIRLSGRLGYVDESMRNPRKIERVLMGIIPPEKQNDFCHRLVMFGRECCTARMPKCDLCPLGEYCTHLRKKRLLEHNNANAAMISTIIANTPKSKGESMSDPSLDAELNIESVNENEEPEFDM